MHLSRALVTIATLAVAGGAHAGMATTTVVDFESGTEGWVGPSGSGGSTFIDEDGGVGGSAGLRTQFINFGITFFSNTNPDFLGDYTRFDSITLGVDVQANQVGSINPVSRPWVLELRDFDTAQGNFPFSSVFINIGTISESINEDFVNYSVTINNPNSDVLPPGWGGTGAFAPNGAPALPENVTFADVLSGVDEIVFTTLEPGFFFTEDEYDVTIDNITISTIPSPGTAVLLSTGGILAARRRR